MHKARDGKRESGLLTGKRDLQRGIHSLEKWEEGCRGLQGKENIFKLKTSLIQKSPDQHFPFTLDVHKDGPQGGTEKMKEDALRDTLNYKNIDSDETHVPSHIHQFSLLLKSSLRL